MEIAAQRTVDTIGMKMRKKDVGKDFLEKPIRSPIRRPICTGSYRLFLKEYTYPVEKEACSL